MVNTPLSIDEGHEFETGMEKSKSAVAGSVNDLIGPTESFKGLMEKRFGIKPFKADDGGYLMYVVDKETYRNEIRESIGRDTIPEPGMAIFVSESIDVDDITIAITTQGWADRHMEGQGLYGNNHYFNHQYPDGFYKESGEE